MKRKWKSLSALCLAAVLGLAMPVSNMWAAEENTETADDVQKTDADSKQDIQSEAIDSQEQIINEEQNTEVVEDQDTLDIVEQDELRDDSVTEESETVLEQPLEEISVFPEDNPLISSEDLLLSEPIFTTADFNSPPVVELKYQGRNYTQSLNVEIEYRLFINNCDQSVSISVSQGSLASLSYYLDNSGSNENKSIEQLGSLWQDAENTLDQEIKLSQDGKYVLYVKAVAGNGQTAYIRTVGLVVDSVRPVITGIQDGGTYLVGTKFGVEDDNLAAVYVNEQEVLPADDGKYQVDANGTSCIIRAKDKADHETTYSITIGEEKPDKPDKPDDPKPGDDITVINSNGTYSLHAGTAYRLGSGNWTLQGDSTVYRGGITFYVNTDGDYIFKKR